MLFSILKRGLFMAGIWLLSYAALTVMEARSTQHYQALEFDQKLQLRPDRGSANPQSRSPIGKLTIPSAGISAIVLEGDDSNTLKIAPGHIPGTAFPGEARNVAIAGHRDTFFRSLEKVRNGDSVVLTTVKGTYEYQIDETEVVDPSRTDVLESSGRPTLTLVTCYPFHWIGAAPERFIVRAHLRPS